MGGGRGGVGRGIGGVSEGEGREEEEGVGRGRAQNYYSNPLHNIYPKDYISDHL